MSIQNKSAKEFVPVASFLPLLLKDLFRIVSEKSTKCLEFSSPMCGSPVVCQKKIVRFFAFQIIHFAWEVGFFQCMGIK